MKFGKYIASLLLKLNQPFMCIPPSYVNPPIIIFSGTQNLQDLILDDFNIRPIFWPKKSPNGGFVHGGFALRTERLLTEMSAFTDKYDNYVLGGHSLGGTCAILTASHLKYMNKAIEGIYVFGTPNLSTTNFKKFYDSQDLNEKTFSYVTSKDPVVKRIPRVYKSLGMRINIICDCDDIWEHHDMKTYNKLV